MAKMEAVYEIQNLVADYTHYSDLGWDDAGYNPTKLAALFTEDGVWTRALRAAASSAAPPSARCSSSWTAHGDERAHRHERARRRGRRPREGRWNGFIPIIKKDNGAQWICGKYNCRFQRTAEGWRIASMRFVAAFQTPYDEGFAKTRFKNSKPVMKTMPV